MRTFYVVLIALLTISTINAQVTTTTKDLDCSNDSRTTCGACTKVRVVVTSDKSNDSNSKTAMTCIVCSNGNTPSSSAITVTNEEIVKKTATADFTSKCFGAIMASSVIAAIVALFFHSY